MLPFLGADLRLQVEFPLFSLATAAYRPTFQLTFSTASKHYPDFAAALGGKRPFASRVGPPIPCREPFRFAQGVSVNTFSNSELVIEGLRVAANTHIEPEIDMIQIMDVGN